jgi:hypothetical protein
VREGAASSQQPAAGSLRQWRQCQPAEYWQSGLPASVCFSPPLPLAASSRLRLCLLLPLPPLRCRRSVRLSSKNSGSLLIQQASYSSRRPAVAIHPRIAGRPAGRAARGAGLHAHAPNRQIGACNVHCKTLTRLRAQAWGKANNSRPPITAAPSGLPRSRHELHR